MPRPQQLKKASKIKMELAPKKAPAAVPKGKAKAPPTEAEISLGLISDLLKASATVVNQSKDFMTQLEALKTIYSESAIEMKILDPLLIALDLRGIGVAPGSSLEGTLAANQALRELWTGEVYADASEDEAVKRLTADMTRLGGVLKTKSYRSFLKDSS